jgi:predicted metalloendopeptidase
MATRWNPHSPGEFRVNGVVANEPEFAAAFKCPAGAPMAPPPGQGLPGVVICDPL